MYTEKEIGFLKSGLEKTATSIAIQSFLGKVFLEALVDYQLKTKMEVYVQHFKEQGGVGAALFEYGLKEEKVANEIGGYTTRFIPEVNFLTLAQDPVSKKLIYANATDKFSASEVENNRKAHAKIPEEVTLDLLLSFDNCCEQSNKLNEICHKLSSKLYPTMADNFDPNKKYLSSYLLLLLPYEWREDWEVEKAFPALVKGEKDLLKRNGILSQIMSWDNDTYKAMQKTILVDSGMLTVEELEFWNSLYSKNKNNMIRL